MKRTFQRAGLHAQALCKWLSLAAVVGVLCGVIGAVFHMLSTFQPDEQKTRYFLLGNTAVFALYFILIRSTSILSSVVTLCSTLAGIWHYRKK